jgi:hypothetical protein
MSPRKSYAVLPDEACCEFPAEQPIEQPRRRRRQVEELVRDNPLTALAIAVTAGFIIGGGAATRVGRSALASVGRMAVRGAVGNLLVGMLMGSNEPGAKDFENRS